MENVNIFGETLGEIGSLDKNLVLRTRGLVYIRFGKKYIELLDSNGNLNVKIPKVIKKIKSNNEASSNGFYMLDGSIYAYIDGELIQLSSIENTSNNNLKLTVKNSEKTIADNFNILNFVGKNYIDFLIDWNLLGNNKTVNIGLDTIALDNKINNIEKNIKNISDRNYNIELVINDVSYLRSKLNVLESYFNINLSQSVITVLDSESTLSITVNSSLDWNINNVSDESWCHPSKLTNNILNIVIDSFSGLSRTAIITISNGIKSETVKIIQGDSGSESGSGSGDNTNPETGETGENDNTLVLNNQIGFVLENNTGETIYFTGRLRMFVGSSYGLHAGDSGTNETNFVFRNTRHYGAPGSSNDRGKYIYSGNPRVIKDTYGHYDNTETLAPEQSMTLIYTDHTIDYSGSTGLLKNCDIYPNISNLSGKYFAFDSSNFNANTSQHIQNQTIKLSVAIDRSSSTYPHRVDLTTGFYRTTLKNSTDFSNSILTGRLYYISITKMGYNHGYVFSDCITPTNSDKIDSSKVSITIS